MRVSYCVRAKYSCRVVEGLFIRVVVACYCINFDL